MKRALIAAGWLFGLLVVAFAAYETALFVAHDFNPDYSAIDGCLDSGGSWDYSNRICNGRR